MSNNKIKIAKNTYWVGVNDRTTPFFEELWPIERGVAYNSYIIKDKSNVLLDTVAKAQMEDFVEKVEKVLDGENLDYLIINHMEPDHAGSIGDIIKRYPNIKIVGNKKTFVMLKGFFGIEDNLVEIKDGDTLDIGSTKLQFIFTPMVHWPESMMTLDTENGVLYSADAFGSFGALEGGIFNDQIDMTYYEDEMRRYYSNIVGKYGPMVSRAIKKLEGTKINMICPLHGVIWRNNLSYTLQLYKDWATFKAKKGALIIYGTMYGNNEMLADEIGRELVNQNVKDIKVVNASKVHLSYILSDIWKYKAVIIGSCAYNTSCHPTVETVLHKLELYGAKNRISGIFGTCSWSGGGVSTIKKHIEKLGWDIIGEPVEAIHKPNENDFEKCRLMAKNIADELKKD